MQAKSQGMMMMFCDLDVCFFDIFGCACSKLFFLERKMDWR